jgi:hypothetical protein
MNTLFFVAQIKNLSFVFQVPAIAFSVASVQNPVQSMKNYSKKKNEQYLSLESKCKNSLFGTGLAIKNPPKKTHPKNPKNPPKKTH